MKVAVLVSGGVDSSVALRLLKEEGHDVTAFYLKVWLEDELDFLGECPWEEDLEYVHELCDHLGIEVRVVPLQQDYRERVISYALHEIEQGRTPNPDIMCNSRIKFGCFYDRIDERFDGEFEKVATGHYANVRRTGDIYRLTTTPDPVKDQTYFLAHLSQAQVSRALFPIGKYRKSEVRELAHRFDLPTQARKDSQGLCFLGKISFRDFIKHYLGERRGDIVELESGERLGEHQGFWFYTIGQRSGLGLSGGPWYVTQKDPATNTVYISRNYFSEDKERNAFRAGEFNWIEGDAPAEGELKVKLRHGEKMYDCSLESADADFTSAKVSIKGRDQGIAAGQFAVFYDRDGDVCLGCGMILEAL